MQKKLLSLLMVTGCVFIYSEDASKTSVKKVPVISEAEHAQNKKTYDELTAKEKSLQEQIRQCQEERDGVELKVHSHLQRNHFTEAFLKQTTDQPGTIEKYKTNSENNTNKVHADAKQQDNGIERAWFTGVTDPVPGSRAGQVYGRETKRAMDKNTIDSQLSEEHTEYVQIVEKQILPIIDTYLSDLAATFDNHTRAFSRCADCRTNESAFKACLKKKKLDGITEKFLSDEEAEIAEDAYSFMKAANIPVTKENTWKIVAANTVTKGSFLKMTTSRERLKKAIKGELDPKLEEKKGTEGKSEQKTPTQNPPAPKPNIVPSDKK